MTDTLERRVECTTGKSPKLLFRVCSRGIKVWCELHRHEVLYEWSALEGLRRSMEEAQTLTASAGICADRNLL